MLEHELELALERFEISDLTAREVWSQEKTAVCPAFTIIVEDSMTQKQRESLRRYSL